MMQLEEAFGPAVGTKQTKVLKSDETRRGAGGGYEGMEGWGREKRGVAIDKREQERWGEQSEGRKQRERATGGSRREEERADGGRWGDSYGGEAKAQGREDDGGRVRGARHRERLGGEETRNKYGERDRRRYDESAERKRTVNDKYESVDRWEERASNGRHRRMENSRADEQSSGRFGGARVRERAREDARWNGGDEAGGSRRWADDVEEEELGRWGDAEDTRGGRKRRTDY